MYQHWSLEYILIAFEDLERTLFDFHDYLAGKVSRGGTMGMMVILSLQSVKVRRTALNLLVSTRPCYPTLYRLEPLQQLGMSLVAA